MTEQRRRELVTEYFDYQLWQFISINEWLEANKEQQNVSRRD